MPTETIRVVAIGGSLRAGSSTETVIRAVSACLEARGALTEHFVGAQLDLPAYEPDVELTDDARRLVESVRRADALVIGSPGYHGQISGLVKNALDYLEELRADSRPYLEGLPVVAVSTAYGWQAAVHTLSSIRHIIHALRGWPTPLGIACNVAEGQVVAAGAILDQKVRQSVAIAADQLIGFVRCHRMPSENAA